MSLWARALPALLILSALAAEARAQGVRMLDDFAAPSSWRAGASDGVTAAARPFDGGLRLDYDFGRGSGYAFLHRPLALDLPENFEIRFRLRGEGPANTLEIKLIDASGANVWWHRRPGLVPPGAWTTFRVRRRQIAFAWGPTQDRTLRQAAAIEFVVAAGSGGRGWLAIDDLSITPLAVPPAVPPRPIASATGGDGAANAVDRDPATAWTAPAGASLDLDLGFVREFGGLALHWAGADRPADYDVLLSDDGRSWRTVREVRGGDGRTDWIRLEESEARFVRLHLLGGRALRFPLAEVEVESVAFGETANAFVTAVAAATQRGAYPRGFVGEQNYWTLLATPAGGNGGLIDESGAIEIGRGGVSVEPFVVDGGRLVSWADVESVDTLRDGDLPIPRVTWRGPGWTLGVTAFAERDRLIARYAVRNAGPAARDLTLVLAVRPFQVNPPQQFLNLQGGVSPISSLAAGADGALLVNGVPAIRPADGPDTVRMATFDSGPLPQSLATAGSAPVIDPTGLASGALVYRLHLAPGETREVAAALALAPGAAPLAPAGAASSEEAAARLWRGQLDRVGLHGPPAAEPIFAALRSALAQILMTRDGPALRPGSRAYARSWIRDGAMMSGALLRLGHEEAAAAFLDYYAPFQFPDGKVPCCVDARGADPVPEHDSDGELIHLVAETQLYAPDPERLRRLWPRVRAAADHIETLRRQTRTAANRAGERRPYFGLLPPSISHEGYSASPAYSYWDDFWGLTGLQDAAWLAGALSRDREAASLHGRSEEFRADILASLAAQRAVHHIAFIPGAADLGDFDATSTTIALSVAGLQHGLDARQLAATFERYWAEFLARRSGARAWDAYTPYEWRNVGAFVRLGWRDRIPALLDFLMAGRRPAAWNQWAEVVGREPRAPRFIGDMPHGWVASDFINAVLDMLAYDRAGDHALVIGAGIPDAWLADGGLRVERLRTPWGLLAFSLRADGDRVLVAYRLEGRRPPGGIVLALGPARPLAGLSGETQVPR